MNKLILVGIGSAIGGILRYRMSVVIHHILGKDFPYGTLAVNALGGLLIGFLFVTLLKRTDAFSEQVNLFLLVGFLGGFTTFSSFCIETVILYKTSGIFGAFVNIIASNVLCLSLTCLGMFLAKQL